ncbi:hypothetical protein [Pseudomonas sp. CC120222-01a]|uniref:hypothetical protein n=1 Tax=Pseudomonas sp. CC120222-01a TaxID=1378075 RepID=UPI000D8F3587|nr:hypothetical protein [Pseudomonas sp. CC120222-01a]PVZ43874.1 hypothetical protein N430_00355 [Pseudomonas sp. CC120222-01a]
MSRRVLVLVCLLLAIVGCAGKRPPAPPPPAVLDPAAWQRIDQELIEASAGAAGSANDYARRSMRVWKEQVQQRTEKDFIPWFTGYWTQQWLTMKVAWYKLDSGEGREPAEKRLALYLQEQYHQRVIEPVAEQINPEGIRDRACELYIQLFGQQLHAIIQRYNAAPEQISQRLNRIPAIHLGPPPARNASLYELLRAKSLEQQPAWLALRDHLHKQAAKGPGRTDAGLSSVATDASEKIGATLAPRGIASAVASAVGKVAGAMISIVSTGYGIMAHNRDQPQMIEQLRVILNVALNQEWQELMENRQSGALAGVYYLSGQVEDSLLATMPQPSMEQQTELRQAPAQQEPLLIRLP